MRVVIVCKAPRGSRTGNRRTAERWARLLREVGHHVRIAPEVPPHTRVDLLIALHARHSAADIATSRRTAPERPIVLALTGTDLSKDIHTRSDAQRAMELADRLVVLHDLAPAEVPRQHRRKVRVIRQSATGVRARKGTSAFDVAVVGHLRHVKDPMRTAFASRMLPTGSRVSVLHAGRALERTLERAARAEEKRNPRYRWLGELSPARTLRLIARVRVVVLSSFSEGGANVLGEAVACGTPIIASDIPAARAALGPRYPAVFPVGDTKALAHLLARAERDAAYLADLARRVASRRSLFSERSERSALRALMAELA